MSQEEEKQDHVKLAAGDCMHQSKPEMLPKEETVNAETEVTSPDERMVIQADTICDTQMISPVPHCSDSLLSHGKCLFHMF